VVETYYMRRRLLVEQLHGPISMDQRLRLEEVTALLDAFTGGKFRRMLPAVRGD
jgi:hypothetical protein